MDFWDGNLRNSPLDIATDVEVCPTQKHPDKANETSGSF